MSSKYPNVFKRDEVKKYVRYINYLLRPIFIQR